MKQLIIFFIKKEYYSISRNNPPGINHPLKNLRFQISNCPRVILKKK